MVRNLAILRKINLSVQSRKSPVFQFEFLGKLNFSDPETPRQSQLYQNNLSNRTNQPGQKTTPASARSRNPRKCVSHPLHTK